MSEPKWTLGPWRVDYESIGSMWTNSISVRDADEALGHVCHLTRGFEADEDGDGCPSFANARLIAAAPELYEAVKAALNMVDGDGTPPRWDWLREVLSKATKAA